MKSHDDFKTKLELPFELIADTEEKMCHMFGVVKNKIMYANDYPMLHYEKIIGDWKSEGYSEDVLARIFTNNAERFLKMVQGAQ